MVLHIGREQNITSPVLVYIPEITVSLGVIFRNHGKIIVISLHVPMLSGIYVKNRVLSSFYGKSAPQYIIHIRLLTVGIKNRIRGFRFNEGSKLPCFFCRPVVFILKIGTVQSFRPIICQDLFI